MDGLLDEFKTRQEKKDTGYDDLDMYMDGAMGKGSFDDGDPTTTTNIFISYLAPTMTEEQLFDLFAKYGPKISVKVSSSLSKSHDITIIVAIILRLCGQEVRKNVLGKETAAL